jgi:hypothetical protein
MKIIELVKTLITLAGHKKGQVYGERLIRRNILMIVDEEIKEKDKNNPFRQLDDESPAERVSIAYVSPDDFENPDYAEIHNRVIDVLSFNNYFRKNGLEKKWDYDKRVIELRALNEKMETDERFFKVEEIETIEKIIVQDFWNW